jgi:lipoate-protein ligase A
VAPLIQTWRLVDSGPQSGVENMAADVQALANPKESTLRFFQWNAPTVSYGHLMAVDHGIKRPTGGGIVHHETTDLSLSLVWPRGHHILPEKPRACYEAIHQRLKIALGKWNPALSLDLYVSCATEPKVRKILSVCFEEPVCNDIMRDGKKLVGGALRITRGAILYQGNILLERTADVDGLKKAIAAEFI